MSRIDVAGLVRQHRQAYHETQAQYAKRFGAQSATSVSLWESGKRKVPERVLLEILNTHLPQYELCNNCKGAGLVVTNIKEAK